MKQNEFVALIGYDGTSAIIDGEFARKYGKKSALELAELGYYRAAVCATIYQEGEGSAELLAWLHHRNIFTEYSYEDLASLFGVQRVEGVERVVRV